MVKALASKKVTKVETKQTLIVCKWMHEGDENGILVYGNSRCFTMRKNVFFSLFWYRNEINTHKYTYELSINIFNFMGLA